MLVKQTAKDSYIAFPLRNLRKYFIVSFDVLVQLTDSLDLVALRQKQTSAEKTSSYHTAEERTSLMAKINSYNEGQSPAHQIKLVCLI